MANLNITNKQEKNSTVFTPEELSHYLYKLVTNEYDFKTIFDPCIGANGGMTKYYYENGYEVVGADIVEEGVNHCHTFFNQDIHNSNIPNEIKPDLIIMNPPFSGNGKGKNLLYPHLFLKTMFDKFGKDIPLVMITGDNFLNNNGIQSKRLKYISDASFEITSIMTLPLDLFQGVEFNTQVLFFNMPKLKAHYIFDISKILSPSEVEIFIERQKNKLKLKEANSYISGVSSCVNGDMIFF